MPLYILSILVEIQCTKLVQACLGVFGTRVRGAHAELSIPALLQFYATKGAVLT